MSDDATVQNLLAIIAKSVDREWLATCRAHNLKPGKSATVAEATALRLRDLDLNAALAQMGASTTLEGRVDEALRVYREILKHKHGRNQAAGYTERAIRDHGPHGAILVALQEGKKTSGLRQLAEADRLDCSYEQIAIDFADDFPPDVIERAKLNLETIRAELAAENARTAE